MKAISSGRRAGALSIIALFLVQSAALACPGCKSVEGAPLSGVSIGFGVDVFFMIGMIGALLGGLGLMMYRSCQALAARDRALADGEGFPAAGGAS